MRRFQIQKYASPNTLGTCNSDHRARHKPQLLGRSGLDMRYPLHRIPAPQPRNWDTPKSKVHPALRSTGIGFLEVPKKVDQAASSAAQRVMRRQVCPLITAGCPPNTAGQTCWRAASILDFCCIYVYLYSTINSVKGGVGSLTVLSGHGPRGLPGRVVCAVDWRQVCSARQSSLRGTSDQSHAACSALRRLGCRRCSPPSCWISSASGFATCTTASGPNRSMCTGVGHLSASTAFATRPRWVGRRWSRS